MKGCLCLNGVGCAEMCKAVYSEQSNATSKDLIDRLGFVLESGGETHTDSPTVFLAKLWKNAVGGLLIKPLRSACVWVCEADPVCRLLAVFICAGVRRIETRC